MHVIPVTLRESRSYEVFVGAGALEELPRALADHCPAAKYAVIADEHVAKLHGARLMERLDGLDARLFTFPAGEWNKNREQWAALTDALLAWQLGRDGAVIAFGGGVTGDLAGFVAATYLRGIPFVQVPTSLLAMIDSSVGGKTGIDVTAGKNLVGAFHQPRAVVADVSLLKTLPTNQVAAGLAEAVKHGVILDADYFASLADATPCLTKDIAVLETVVRRSIALKAGVVSADEREGGRRQILNFGHTVGHAIESVSGYELLHGEAIAIGMTVESRIAEDAGIAERGISGRIAETLEACRLPVEMPTGIEPDRVINAMKHDKKVRGNRVRMSLPKKIGVMLQSADGAWTVEVEDELVRRAMSLL